MTCRGTPLAAAAPSQKSAVDCVSGGLWRSGRLPTPNMGEPYRSEGCPCLRAEIVSGRQFDFMCAQTRETALNIEMGSASIVPIELQSLQLKTVTQSLPKNTGRLTLSLAVSRHTACPIKITAPTNSLRQLCRAFTRRAVRPRGSLIARTSTPIYNTISG